MNKYKPSKEFVFSVFLLFSSFLILQNLIIPDLINKDLSAQLISFTSKRVETAQSGVLRIQYFEELNPKTKKMMVTEKSYFLENTNGKGVQIYPKNVDESLDGLTVDYKNGEVVLNNIQASKLNSKSRSKGDVEVIKTLVLLAEFGNSNPIEATAQDFQDLLFTKPTQSYLKRFFSEMTHGKVQIGGDVFGWYRFKGNGANYTRPPIEGGEGQCFLTKNNIQKMIDFYNVSISQYDRIITISNCQEYNTIGGAEYGSSEFGIPLIRTTSNSSRLDLSGFNGYGTFHEPVWNIIHEMGHTFNLYHSSSLDCNEKTIWNDCLSLEYGNPFDAMGHWSGRIFSFLQQLRAGWIDESNILEISESGDYFINNLQTEGGVVGARISAVLGNPYPIFALEHRKSTGFDQNLSSDISNGLLIYSLIKPSQVSPWPVEPDYFSSRWRISDPHPTNQDIYDDTVYDSISVGNSFYDPVFGLSIEVTSVTSEGINFRVTYDYDNSICGTENNILSTSLCSFPLPPPDNFSVDSLSYSQVDLIWGGVTTEATNLVLERSAYPSSVSYSPVLNFISPDVTSSSTNLIWAQTYFRIRAENNLTNNVSPWVYLGPVVRPPLLPDTISNFIGTSSIFSEVNLIWDNDILENSTNLAIQGYSSNGWVDVDNFLPPEAVSYSATGDQVFPRYRIRVEDSATGLYSQWILSNYINIEPPHLTIENFSGVAISPFQVNLTWDNLATDATNLTLETQNSFGAWVSVSDPLPPNSTSYSVVYNLLFPVNYYRIRAEDSLFEVYSPWVYIYGIYLPDPELTIENFSATAITPLNINLTWDNLATDATNLAIQGFPNGWGDSILLPPDATNYSVPENLIFPGINRYRIRAENSTLGTYSDWIVVFISI